jgi:septal ring factor EnvC (AmiA/AmiB activator)
LTKFEEKMVESIKSLSSKFDSLQTELSDLSNKVASSEPVMQNILDKLSTMEARQVKSEERQVKSEERVAAMLSTMNDAAVRLQRLEQPPHLPQ